MLNEDSLFVNRKIGNEMEMSDSLPHISTVDMIAVLIRA
jgi:hypothetical protein